MQNNFINYREIFYSSTKFIILKNIFFLISGLLSIFIVRLLPVQEYGKWSLVYQLIATLGPIVNLGFLTTLAKFIPEYQNEEEKNKLFSQVIYVNLISFIIFTVIFLFIISTFSQIFPKEIKDIKYTFCIFIGALNLINLIEGYYRGLGKFNQWSVIDGSRSILSAGLSVLLIFILSPKYETIFYTYFFIIIFFSIILLFYLKNNINLTKKLNIEPKILKFSLTMFLGYIVYYLMTNVNPILLRSLLKNTTEVGYYFAGIRLPQVVELSILGYISTPFLYYFSIPDAKEIRKKIMEEGTRLISIFLAIISLLLFSFADILIPFLFTENYGNSILVLRIYSSWIFLSSLQVFGLIFFVSINKPMISTCLGFLFFLLNLCLDIFLIPIYKSSGAALASITSMGILVCCYFYFYIRNKINIIEKTYITVLIYICSVIFELIVNLKVSWIVFIVGIIITKQITTKDKDMFLKILFRNQSINI